MSIQSEQLEVAVFGGGCFWCTEAIFKELRGVVSVMPGYAGGTTDRADYEFVSSGKSGHAEVIRIEFDPQQIAFRDLVTVFFGTHNPTTPNRQGNDVGTQYRSVIFYSNDTQCDIAREYIRELQQEGIVVVTQVEPLGAFFEAEDYHRNYYANNPQNPYCEAVIEPKLAKLRANFSQLLKTHGA